MTVLSLAKAVRTSAIQLQYKKNSCIAVVWYCTCADRLSGVEGNKVLSVYADLPVYIALSPVDLPMESYIDSCLYRTPWSTDSQKAEPYHCLMPPATSHFFIAGNMLHWLEWWQIDRSCCIIRRYSATAVAPSIIVIPIATLDTVTSRQYLPSTVCLSSVFIDIPTAWCHDVTEKQNLFDNSLYWVRPTERRGRRL